MNVEIGIYKITNLINGKIYIGQSRNIKKRWQNHKCAAHNPNNKGYNYPLYRAIRKYGIENFRFEIIESCFIEELNDREKYWISYYHSNDNDYGYNQDDGGNTPHPLKLNEVQVDEIIKALLYTEISQNDLAQKYQVDQSLISNINTGKSWVKDILQYPLREKEEYFKKIKNPDTYCIDCGTKILFGSTRCDKCNRLKNRKVNRPNREELKQLIKTLPFTKIGEMFGVTDNAIRKWCKNENLPYRKADIEHYTEEDWKKI